MATIPIVYAQGLAGERWRHYAPWARYVPVPLLERLGERLPTKRLWQELISCGDRQAELSVLSTQGHASTLAVELRETVSDDALAPVVWSHNLAVGSSRRHRWLGRTLAMGLLRRILPALARELELFGDRLTVALAVAEWERAFWVSGIEPFARAITVFLQKNERSAPLGSAGVAIRQASYASGKVEAHVLVVSPECAVAVGGLALRHGTAVISTDGLPVRELLGCWSVDFGLAERIGLPPLIWADGRDMLPVLETVAIAAFLSSQTARWPSHPTKQLLVMDQALTWSEWPVVYRLQAVNPPL